MTQQMIGQMLGRYRLDVLLGEGGMGAVYRALDLTLQREVAVKVMHAHYARQAEFQERFLQEARAAAQLDHPGIVKVFDFDQDRSHYYIVMEFIEGYNLHDLLASLREKAQWIGLAEAVALISQVAEALDYAHRQRVLHRDIKPSNIMLKRVTNQTLPYRPIITDLGLAKLAGGLESLPGSSMGTPAYMAPEQARGQLIDARSDVYSLGVLLFELATGRLPFPITSLTEAVHYHTQEPPPLPRSLRPDLPQALEDVIRKAMEKTPAARFPSAQALADALMALPPQTLLATAPPTAQAGAGSLLTQLQQSPDEPRGASIFADFPAAQASAGEISIQVLAPDGRSRALPFQPPVMVVGRGGESNLVLDDDQVSRLHVRIERDGGDLYVKDLDSSNGTYFGSAKLLPGVPERWDPDKPMRIGQHWLRLTLPGTAQNLNTVAAQPVAQQSRSRGRIGLHTEVTKLSVEPGASVSLPLVVLNQGTTVDHFLVTTTGVPPLWLRGAPPDLQLMPGEQRPVTLVLQPPRSPQSHAGQHQLGVLVTSREDPTLQAEMQIPLQLGAYGQFHTTLLPQQIVAGKPAGVEVENQGNTSQTFALAWKDQAGDLAFTPHQSEVELAPEQKAVIAFQARPLRRRWVGQRKSHPITVAVSAANGETQLQQGEVVSRALIPPWVPPLMGLLVLALLFLAYRFIVRPPVITDLILDPPNPVAGEAVTIYWTIDNAQTVELRPVIAGLDAGAGQYIFPNGFPADPNLTVVATNRFNHTEKSLSIPVRAVEPGRPVVKWNVFPLKVTLGQPVTIRWDVTNAETVRLQPFGTMEGNAGEYEDRPQQTKTYTLIADNKGQQVEKSQEVVVVVPPPDAPAIKDFSVEPKELVRGEVDVLTVKWDIEKADTVTIEPELGVVGVAGSRTVDMPSTTTVFTLVAKGTGGETRAEAQVSIEAPLCIVAVQDLNLRPGPGTIYNPAIQKLPLGTRLEPLLFQPTGHPEGRWIQVRLPDNGETGWVNAADTYVDCNLPVANLSQAAPGDLLPTPTPTPHLAATAQVVAAATAQAEATMTTQAETAAQATATAQAATATAMIASAETATAEARFTVEALTATAVVHPSISVSAARESVNEGECTVLFWTIQGVQEIFLDEVLVDGESSSAVCPSTTTSYTWRIVKFNGEEEYRTIEVAVVPATTVYDFTAEGLAASAASGPRGDDRPFADTDPCLSRHSFDAWLPWVGDDVPDGYEGEAGLAQAQMKDIEDGSRELFLHMHPRWVTNGTIAGIYPATLVSPHSFFKANVGFVDGASGTDGVTFWLCAQHTDSAGGTVSTQLLELPKFYTGALEPIEVNLSSLAGKTVEFVLGVDAGASAGQDWAVWVDPRIVAYP